MSKKMSHGVVSIIIPIKCYTVKSLKKTENIYMYIYIYQSDYGLVVSRTRSHERGFSGFQILYLAACWEI